MMKYSKSIGSKIDKKTIYNDSEFLKSNDFVLLLITFLQNKIEDPGLRLLKDHSNSFQAFFEKLKSVEKRLKCALAKLML